MPLTPLQAADVSMPARYIPKASKYADCSSWCKLIEHRSPTKPSVQPQAVIVDTPAARVEPMQWTVSVPS